MFHHVPFSRYIAIAYQRKKLHSKKLYLKIYSTKKSKTKFKILLLVRASTRDAYWGVRQCFSWVWLGAAIIGLEFFMSNWRIFSCLERRIASPRIVSSIYVEFWVARPVGRQRVSSVRSWFAQVAFNRRGVIVQVRPSILQIGLDAWSFRRRAEDLETYSLRWLFSAIVMLCFSAIVKTCCYNGLSWNRLVYSD